MTWENHTRVNKQGTITRKYLEIFFIIRKMFSYPEKPPALADFWQDWGGRAENSGYSVYLSLPEPAPGVQPIGYVPWVQERACLEPPAEFVLLALRFRKYLQVPLTSPSQPPPFSWWLGVQGQSRVISKQISKSIRSLPLTLWIPTHRCGAQNYSTLGQSYFSPPWTTWYISLGEEKANPRKCVNNDWALIYNFGFSRKKGKVGHLTLAWSGFFLKPGVINVQGNEGFSW